MKNEAKPRITVESRATCGREFLVDAWISMIDQLILAPQYYGSYSIFQTPEGIGSYFYNYIINAIYFANFNYTWYIFQFV